MSPELTVLTAMITPAVLISACGALVLSTSVRLGRVVDRVRSLSDRFEELAHKEPSEIVLFEERLELTFTQLDWLTSRARHLQRAMTSFYLALGLFVATTVAIGFLGISSPVDRDLNWVPVILGMVGAGMLFVGTLLLGLEATLALRSIHSEMDFVWKLGRHHAPGPLPGPRSDRAGNSLPPRRVGHGQRSGQNTAVATAEAGQRRLLVRLRPTVSVRETARAPGAPTGYNPRHL